MVRETKVRGSTKIKHYHYQGLAILLAGGTSPRLNANELEKYLRETI